VAALTGNGYWNYGSLHSEPIQWIFEFGIIGFVLLLAAAGCFIRQCWTIRLTATSAAWIGAGVAYLPIMLFNFPWRIGSLLMLGVVIYAALVTYGQEGHQDG